MENVPELTVAVHNQDGVIYQGQVKAISSMNNLGPFDILSAHANFITLIKDKLILHHQSGQPQEVPISSGVLECLDSQVNIYLDLTSSAPIINTASAST